MVQTKYFEFGRTLGEPTSDIQQLFGIHTRENFRRVKQEIPISLFGFTELESAGTSYTLTETGTQIPSHTVEVIAFIAHVRAPAPTSSCTALCCHLRTPSDCSFLVLGAGIQLGDEAGSGGKFLLVCLISLLFRP